MVRLNLSCGEPLRVRVCPDRLWSAQIRILREIGYSVLLTSTFTLITMTANYDFPPPPVACARLRHADKQSLRRVQK